MNICLNMIVRNEGHVIRRALESARPFVHFYCIVDTGSEDDTLDILNSWPLPNLTYYRRDWVNFGYNRNEALELARRHGHYILFLDADDILTGTPEWPELTLPAYNLTVDYDSLSYGRCALVRSDCPWRWEGVLHEYLTSDVPLEQGTLNNPHIKIMGGGARSKDPDKYKKDAALLLDAITKDPGNARYAFYLAQSYKDAGDPAEALLWYRRRAQMNGWVEENWYAKYMAAQLQESTERDDVTRAYLEAFQYRPTRAEPLFQLARYHRLRGEHALAYMYAKHGASMPMPQDRLFLDRSVYEWRLREEQALSGYYIGEKEEGHVILKNLLASGKLPESERAHIEKQLRWYE